MGGRSEAIRILITRNDRLGDVVLASPVILSVRKQFPDCYLGMLVRPAAYEAVSENPHLDTVLIDEGGTQGFKKLLHQLRQLKFDVALILFSDFRMGLLTATAGIPRRIGQASKIAQAFYTQRIVQRRSRALRHEAEYNLELSQAIGAEPICKTEVFISAKVQEQADRFLSGLKLHQDTILVGMHPGCGGSAKNLPPEKWVELAEALTRKLPVTIFITCGPGEERLIFRITSQLSIPYYTYPGPCGIQLLAALMSHFKVMVSPNTGPMHLAAALGAPTVSLFCPIRVCRPERWGPIGNRHLVIRPPLPWCDRCRPKRCPHPDCMDLIRIDKVVNAVGNLIPG